jgi:hypothetical protein
MDTLVFLHVQGPSLLWRAAHTPQLAHADVVVCRRARRGHTRSCEPSLSAVSVVHNDGKWSGNCVLRGHPLRTAISSSFFYLVVLHETRGTGADPQATEGERAAHRSAVPAQGTRYSGVAAVILDNLDSGRPASAGFMLGQQCLVSFVFVLRPCLPALMRGCAATRAVAICVSAQHLSSHVFPRCRLPTRCTSVVPHTVPLALVAQRPCLRDTPLNISGRTRYEL